jgi:hypothetical protein
MYPRNTAKLSTGGIYVLATSCIGKITNDKGITNVTYVAAQGMK